MPKGNKNKNKLQHFKLTIVASSMFPANLNCNYCYIELNKQIKLINS